MANIDYSFEELDDLGFDKKDFDKIKGLYLEMIHKVNSKYGELTGKLDSVWGFHISVRNRNNYTITVEDEAYTVSISRRINIKNKELDHTFLFFRKKLRNVGISNVVAETSLKITDTFGIKKIAVGAGLDVGGYAWLRKGAVPNEGALSVLKISKKEKNPTLFKKLKERMGGMSETNARVFILSKEFSQYKELFLGTSWDGSFDVKNKDTRAAMIGEYVEAKVEPEPIRKKTTSTKSKSKSTTNPRAPPTLTSNEQILDRTIRHQTYLIRYAGGLRNQVLPLLASTEADLHDTIIKWVNKAQGNRTLTGAAGRKWQANFRNALNDVRSGAWAEMTAVINNQFKELVVNEAAVGAATIEDALPVILEMTQPLTSRLEGIINSQPFEGRTLKGWLENAHQADVQRLLASTKIGIIQGQSPTEVARTIVGTRAANRMDGVARKSFRDTESIILTLTNGIQNESKQALYEENSDIVKVEQFVATLDARTTMTCMGAESADKYGLGVGMYPRAKGPIPPLHFRCRSIRVPFIQPEDALTRGFDSRTQKELLQEYSNKAKISPVKNRGDLPRGHKSKYDTFSREKGLELVGTVPAKTTYNSWLKTQTKEFQDQVLGPTRATMFRKGNITLDKFVARDGDVLTLNELSKKGLEIPK